MKAKVKLANRVDLPWIGNGYYHKPTLSHVHMFAGSLYLTLCADAMKTGKTVVRYTIDSGSRTGDGSCDILNAFRQACNNDLALFIVMLDNLGLEGSYASGTLRIGEWTLTVHRSENKAIRCWAPWAKVKPLKAAPKKWNVTSVIKGLLAGQITAFNRMTLTDDYAYDAASNFQKGAMDAMALAKDLISSPSGWWVSTDEQGNLDGVNCHSFQYVDLKFSP